MDEDKRLYKETAQKLIDYTGENRFEYLCGEYDVYRCPGGLHEPYSALLFSVIVFNIILFLFFGKIEAGMSFILLIIDFFLFKNFLKKKKKKNEVLKVRKRILKDKNRISYIDTLNMLKKKHPEWEIEDWWNVYNGFDKESKDLDEWNLELITFPIASKLDDAKYLKCIRGSDGYMEEYDKSDMDEFFDSEDWYRFNIAKQEYKEGVTYYGLPLVLCNTSEEINSYTTKAYNSDEINNLMGEYKDKLDKKEINSNFWNSSLGYGETNQEKYDRVRSSLRSKNMYDGQIRYELESEAAYDEFQRALDEKRKREELSSATVTHQYVSGFRQKFWIVGYFIYSANNKLLDILILNKENPKFEYITSKEEFGVDCLVQREEYLKGIRKKQDIPLKAIIADLRDYKLFEMDFFEKRPEWLTKEEWAIWIYGHITVE